AVEGGLLAGSVAVDALPEGTALAAALLGLGLRLACRRLLSARRGGALDLAALIAHLDTARDVVARRRVAEPLLRCRRGTEPLGSHACLTVAARHLDLEVVEEADRLFADRLHHRLVQREAFTLVLDKRVAAPSPAGRCRP